MFTKATKTQSKGRIGLIGPSGSGKTYTGLILATNLGKRVAVIDSERGSASKYSDLFPFDVCELESFHPQKYIDAIKEAEKAGYDVLLIDSLTHAWIGKDGALELVNNEQKKAEAKGKAGNSFTAWRDVTPLHNRLVDAMLQSKCHIIATLRAKTEYILTPDKNGKMVPQKVGMAPIQRDGMEYEMDIICDLNVDHDLIISKTRCHALDGFVANRPGKELAERILGWLTDGVPAPIRAEPEPPAQKDPDPKPAEESAPPPQESGEPEQASAPAESSGEKLNLGALMIAAGKNGWKIKAAKSYLSEHFAIPEAELQAKLTQEQFAEAKKYLVGTKPA